MRILVTGATGFIGRRAVALLASAHDVVALARSAAPDDGPPGVEWVEQDLASPLDRSALPDQVDAVVHLAQSRRYREFPAGAADVFAVNLAATFGLLEYAREAGAETFVFASTGGVYASSERALSEQDPLNPLNLYLSSKYAAEALVASYRPLFRTVTFRFFFVYGPGQTGMLVPTLLGRVERGETITIEGEPGLRMNPIYVDDAARVFDPALTLDRSELFNVAGDEVVTVRELVALLEEVTGRAAVVEHAPSSLLGDLVGDNTRMKSMLGVAPTTTLRAGLRAMAASPVP